jgi:membrane dipeptidase
MGDGCHEDRMHARCNNAERGTLTSHQEVVSMKYLVSSLSALAFLTGSSVLVGASVPIVDGHNHEGISASEGQIDTSKLDDLKARGIQAVVIALPLDRSEAEDLEGRIADEIERLHKDSTENAGFSLADDPVAVSKGVRDGDIQVFFSIEWFGEIFGADPSHVRRYRDLGVRIIGLAEDDNDGLFEKGDRSATLTPFGRQVVAAMNEAGVLIDITHLTHGQKLHVVAQSQAPVVASHSLVQAVSPDPFNLPDEVITALADSGGSVWVSFDRSGLRSDQPEEDAIDRLVDTIEVLVARLGPDQVGIGTDLQAGGKYVPEVLNQKDSFARIRLRLQDRGFDQKSIDGILGGNVLRVLTAFD